MKLRSADSDFEAKAHINFIDLLLGVLLEKCKDVCLTGRTGISELRDKRKTAKRMKPHVTPFLKTCVIVIVIAGIIRPDAQGLT